MNFFFWKHNKNKAKPVVIKKECYDKLPKQSKEHFHPMTGPAVITHTVVLNNGDSYASSPSDFGLSMLAAETTDNAALGYIAGGDLSGALIGQMMADEIHQENSRQINEQHGGFGGGTTDGGGAGGSFESTPDTTPSYDAGPSVDSTFDMPDLSSVSGDSGGGMDFGN